MWNLANCKLKTNHIGHSGYLNTVTVSPDGSLCASGGRVRAKLCFKRQPDSFGPCRFHQWWIWSVCETLMRNQRLFLRDACKKKILPGGGVILSSICCYIGKKPFNCGSESYLFSGNVSTVVTDAVVRFYCYCFGQYLVAFNTFTDLIESLSWSCLGHPVSCVNFCIGGLFPLVLPVEVNECFLSIKLTNM